MANPSSRSAAINDFAPAWLKLPDQRPETRPDSLRHNVMHIKNGRSHIPYKSAPQMRVQAFTQEKPNSVKVTVEEDFPTLGAPSVVQANQTNTQWIKSSDRNQADNSQLAQKNSKSPLTCNMSGQVYRAHIRPVRRVHMLPIDKCKAASSKGIDNDDLPPLSSSVEKEKRLLHEMGWKEEDDSGEDCEIPEQDPAQLQQMLLQAKANRERLLLKSKQSMKSSPVTAVLPNDSDLPSSSDNSDTDMP